MTPEEKLAELGIELPEAPHPVANYVPFKTSGEFVFISGQIPVVAGELTCKGLVGRDVTLDDAREAARLCAVNILSVVKAAAGELSGVEALRLEGFVASAEGFKDQAAVLNGASDLLVEVLGEAGRHTRLAVGASELPLGAAVEVGAVFALAK